jgi:predicted nucleic acid-binding protein
MERREVRIFLDSNVVLSGLFSDRGSPRIILDLLSLDLPVLRGVTGKFNILEIERNLLKKMPEVLPTYRKYLPLLHLEITPLPSAKEVKSLKGQIAEKDLPVLASGLKADVDFLVTGDKKDFGKARTRGRYPFRIVTPAELLQAILHEILPLIESE